MILYWIKEDFIVANHGVEIKESRDVASARHVHRRRNRRMQLPN